jgi:hypothetical protein
MPEFTLSIRRVDDAERPTKLERLVLNVDWPIVPRVGETVNVGTSLMIDCVVDGVFHEDGRVAVDLGTKVILEYNVETLAEVGWERRPLRSGPPGSITV